MMEDMLDRPQASANHLVLAMNKDLRVKAKGLEDGKSLPTWI